MAKTVADQFAETLAAAGVKRIYGIVGDSLNGLTDSIRRQGKIEWIHVRHEEVAAFAAGAEAHLTGELAVCAGSCGPGNLHLINGLFDCHRSRVPVLGIAAQIPSPEIGSGYFQETHPETLFRECSHYCELVSGANQMPRVLEVAIREAVGKRGVSVIVIPGDVALQARIRRPRDKGRGTAAAGARRHPRECGFDRLAAMLNGDSRVTILCGSGCQGAHAELLALGERLKAPMVHAHAGQGVCRVGEPLRRRHDRADRVLVRLLRDARLRCPADARDRLSRIGNSIRTGPGVRIAQVDIRAENIGRRAAGRSRRRRRRQGDARRLAAALDRNATARI